MPLPVAHGLLGASIVAALHPRLMRRSYVIPLLVGGALLANAADFDFLLAFAFQSKEWHRGFSHSLVFALLCLLPALLLGKQRIREMLAYGLAFTLHGILDYVTSKEGSGVELLWPFSRSRLKLGWCGLSEIPSKQTGVEIIESLALEFLLFVPLLLAVLLLRKPSRSA